MPEAKPKIYLTWDPTGMFLWLGQRPQKRREDGIYFCNAAVRFRMPVTWFGGLVDEGKCHEFDPEEIFARKMANA